MSAAQTGFRSVLHTRHFRRLVVAHAASTVAQVVLVLAVGAHVARTASPVWASLTVSLGFLPYVLCSPLAGLLADRTSRSAVLAWSAAARALLTAGAAAAWALGAGPVAVVALTAAAAVVATPAYPALVAVTPQCVDDDELPAANALVTCVENLSWLAGPGTLGILLLLGLSPLGVLTVTTALFLAAAGLAAPLRIPVPPRHHDPGLWADCVAGLREVALRPRVRRPMALAMLDNALYGYLVAALVLMLAQSAERGRAGWLETALTAGALGSAAAVSGLTRWWTARALLHGSLSGAAASIALLGMLSGEAGVLALLPLVALAGAGLLVAEVAAVTLLQRAADPTATARVFGVYDQLNVGAIAVGSALAGPMAHAFGPGFAAVLVGSVVLLLLALSALAGVRPLSRADARVGADLVLRPWPTSPQSSSSSPPSTSKAAAPSSSSKVLPAQRRPSATPSMRR